MSVERLPCTDCGVYVERPAPGRMIPFNCAACQEKRKATADALHEAMVEEGRRAMQEKQERDRLFDQHRATGHKTGDFAGCEPCNHRRAVEAVVPDEVPRALRRETL